MIYELASLRPPFLGDSFPSLKRAVTLGRYSPLPGKYSEGLSRVIAQMLKLDSKSRPSADMLLKSTDVMCKLELDETSTSFGQQQAESNQPLSLISTIKVPQHLRKLNSALPKPCYPDVRPNSPTSWTVAEQKIQHQANQAVAQQQLQQAQQIRSSQRKPAPLPPVPSLPLPNMTDVGVGAGKENNYPLPTYRSDGGDSACSKPTARAPVPPPPVPGAALAAVADYYNRRPLAPAYPSNRSNLAPHRNVANTENCEDPSAPYKVPGMGYNKPVSFKPTLDPVCTDAENMAPIPPAPPSVPSVNYERHQQYQHQQRAPPRLQYHHNRVW